MYTAQRTIISAARSESIWTLLSDFANIANWNSGVQSSFLLDQQAPIGKGTKRQCNINRSGSQYLREEIIDWQEGKSFTVDIYDATMPLETCHTTVAVVPAHDASEITVTMRYVPKFGWIGRLLNLILLGPMLRKAAGNIGRDLAVAAERQS